MATQIPNHYPQAVLELLDVIPTSRHRKLLNLINVLEDEYQARLAIALKQFVRTGKETTWGESLVMTRLYNAGKHILGYDATLDDFDMKAYHKQQKNEALQ